MTSRRAISTLILSLLMAFGAHRANAVSFEVVDLPDTVVGIDLMKYVYHVDGAFDTFHGFNILFDPARYADLTVITSLGVNWDHVLAQPDPVAPLDGVVSSTALSSIADATGTFEIGFTRLGVGTPGPQPVELFDDSFNVTGTSVSTAFVSDVPEPSTYGLMLAGLLVLARAIKRPAFAAPTAITA